MQSENNKQKRACIIQYMETPLQYKEYVDQAFLQLKNGFPQSFIGMYDSGVDYLFGILNQNEEIKNEYVVIPLDISAIKKEEEIFPILKKGLIANSLPVTGKYTYDSFFESLTGIAKNKKICLLLYCGFAQYVPVVLFSEILRWRFSLNLKINWIVCATYGILQSSNRNHPSFEKIIKTHITPVLPHTGAEAKSVLQDYIGMYGKILPTLERKVLELSGGNPGLMKALYILATTKDLTEPLHDHNLMTRLKRIIDELSTKQIAILQSVALKRTIDSSPAHTELVQFGYLVQDQIFSPLVEKYLLQLYDRTAPELSIQQQKVLNLLLERSPALVTRDEIAQTMWENKWHEQYSDWAIDQIVYSLRQLLKKQKNKTILTRKNLGYYIP